jgi:hypothetical protein
LAVTGAFRYPKAGWIAGSLALAPVAALLTAGAVIHLFAVRYLFFTLTGWAILVGAGLAASTRTARWVSLTLIALLGLPAHQAIRQPDGRPDHGAPAAARDLLARQQRGDTIVYENASWLRAAMDYHLPTTGRPGDVLMTQTPGQAGTFAATECTNPAACLAGVTRIWVVHQDRNRPLWRMTPATAAAIETRYTPVGTYPHGSITLTLYGQSRPDVP